MNYNDLIYWNNRSYGTAITISKSWIKIVMFIIAVLPLGTAWLFVFIPKIKDLKIRYEVDEHGK